MLFFLALRNLFRNSRRTIAILFTVGLGAGALFSFDGFINGVLGELRYNTIHSNYGFGQINTKGYRGAVFEDPSEHWISNTVEIQDFLANLEGVQDIFPRVSFSALITKGNITVAGLGQGVEAAKEADFFHSLNVEEGETLREEPKGILLGRGLAKALQVNPGDTVKVIVTSGKGVINQNDFVVTGIFHTGSLDFDGRMFRVQLPSAQKLLNTDKIELISLGLRDLADWNQVAKAIESNYPHLEATSFDVLDSIYYKNTVDWLKAQFNIVQVIILTIVLLGIFNSVSASILERTQEIGNLRANGESIPQVMYLIMVEGSLLAFLGSLIGMAVVYSLLMLFVHKALLMPPGPGQTRQFYITFAFEGSMVIYSLIISCVAASLASFLAGIKVTKMPIAKALRSH